MTIRVASDAVASDAVRLSPVTCQPWSTLNELAEVVPAVRRTPAIAASLRPSWRGAPAPLSSESVESARLESRPRPSPNRRQLRQKNHLGATR
jgi:hypothetical protein